MTTKEYIEEAEGSLLHTYNRYQIVLEKEMEHISMIQMVRNILILLQELQYLHLVTIIKNIMMH